MRFSLLPKLITPKVTDLRAEFLQQKGIRLLMLDFDNTIVPYTTSKPTPEMESWLREMIASPVAICVVSNSHKSRVRRFCKKYGIDCITHAKKPFSKGIRECLEKYGLAPEACALAGDQVYTDVLGANCAGVYSIRVDAISNHNIWLKARHLLEIPILYIARKRTLAATMAEKPENFQNS